MEDEQFGALNSDDDCDWPPARDVAGEDEPLGGDEEAEGMHSKSMMNGVGNQKSALQEHAKGVAETLKENSMMENLAKSVDCTTNIILSTCVNGKREKVNFLNCKSGDINVAYGKISYFPSPSFHLDSPLSLPSPNSEPNENSSSLIPNTPTNSSHSSPSPNHCVQPTFADLAQNPGSDLAISSCSAPALEVVGHPPQNPPLSPSHGLVSNSVPSSSLIPQNLSLVVDLSPYFRGSLPNIESQPIHILSHASEEPQEPDSSSNNVEGNHSNLVVENENSIWADKTLS